MNETRNLRIAFATNGAFSLISATLFLLAAEPLAEIIGLGLPVALQLIGVGLVPFGLWLMWLSRSATPSRISAFVVCSMDVDWVLGTAALLIFWPNLLNPTGQLLAISIACVVASLAIWQWMGIKRIPVTA